MNKHNQFYCALLTLALLSVLSICPAISQKDDSPNKAVETLQNAIEKTFSSTSYTIKLEQKVKRTQSMSNVTVNQKTTGTVQYEKPFVFIKLTTDVSGGSGRESKKTNSRKMVGKVGKNKKLIGLLQRKKGSGAWNTVTKTKRENVTTMTQLFQNPSTLSKRLSEVQTAGEEKINGTACLKITAKPKDTIFKKMARTMLKGSSQNKMIQQMDLGVDVKESEMTAWIRTKSSLIERIKSDSKQDVTLSISISGKKRSFAMKNKHQFKLRFNKYGSTSIRDRYKTAYKKHINKN